MSSALDRFDESSAVIRVILFLKKHPKSNISTIIHNVTAGQRAVYSAKAFLEKKQSIGNRKEHSLTIQ
jgi:hypothetical protein